MSYRCQICGSTFKKPDGPTSSRHINSNKHKGALIKKGTSTSLTRERRISSSAKQPTDMIFSRLENLENQMKFVISKITKIESNSAQSSLTMTYSELERLEQQILKIIPRGDSISVDELLSKRQFKQTPFNNIEKAILALIDGQKIEGTEGKSKFKVDGYIGRLIQP